MKKLGYILLLLVLQHCSSAISYQTIKGSYEKDYLQLKNEVASILADHQQKVKFNLEIRERLNKDLEQSSYQVLKDCVDKSAMYIQLLNIDFLLLEKNWHRISENTASSKESNELVQDLEKSKAVLLQRMYDSIGAYKKESQRYELSFQNFGLKKSDPKLIYGEMCQTLDKAEQKIARLRISFVQRKMSGLAKEDEILMEKKQQLSEDLHELEKVASSLRQKKELFHTRYLKDGYYWNGPDMIDYKGFVAEKEALLEQMVKKYD